MQTLREFSSERPIVMAAIVVSCLVSVASVVRILVFDSRPGRLGDAFFFSMVLLLFVEGVSLWRLPPRLGSEAVCARCGYPDDAEKRPNTCPGCGADLTEERMIATGARAVWLGRAGAISAWILAWLLILSWAQDNLY